MQHVSGSRNKKQLDPKKLFELVSKNYENWSHAMSSQFHEDENFSPFPSENEGELNCSLLEALESTQDDLPNKASDMSDDKIFREIQDQLKKRGPKENEFPLLKQSEINFLRDKITQMINHNELASYKEPQGFSLYDSCDEEGLHEGNTDAYYDDDQGDYDIEEITGDEPPTRHIEVELNGTTECALHGFDCDCPRESALEGGPSCEFTFEYDGSGKLVPVYNNVEEKLRMMSLEDKKKKKKELPSHPDRKIEIGRGDCCLFCEYEAVFGEKPRQMIKWYENKMHRDTMRREEIKTKLASAKSRAMKKRERRDDECEHDTP